MNTISITMPERTTIKKIGNSAGIILDKGALKVYNLAIGDDIELDYKFPVITIKRWVRKKDDKEIV